MTKQLIILTIIICASFIISTSILYILLKPSDEISLLDVGSQSAYNAVAVKTKMEPLDGSLDEFLDGYRVVSTNKTSTGLIAMLEEIRTGLDITRRRNILCILTFPNPKKGQYEATSRCWSLN